MSAMLTNSRELRIEWGDCDPAGIVFYPRYFAMFDHSTTSLFTRATGLSKFEMFKTYSFAGYPMVDTRAKFSSPCRFGDDVVIESRVTEFRRSSFDIEHRLSKKNGELAVEGFETRVWIIRHPDDETRIKSQPIPAELIALFSK